MKVEMKVERDALPMVTIIVEDESEILTDVEIDQAIESLKAARDWLRETVGLPIPVREGKKK